MYGYPQQPPTNVSYYVSMHNDNNGATRWNPGPPTTTIASNQPLLIPDVGDEEDNSQPPHGSKPATLEETLRGVLTLMAQNLNFLSQNQNNSMGNIVSSILPRPNVLTIIAIRL